MFKRILVTTDGSEFSLRAVRLAAALAARLSASCSVVMVTEEPVADEFERLQASYERQAREALAAARASAAELGVEIGTLYVGRSPVVRGILKAAEDDASDLIVIASHGAAGFERLLLGSTAKKLLAHSRVPVLIVRGEEQPAARIETIVMPTDGSELSQRASAVAFNLASALDASVRIVTVMPVPEQPGMGVPYWGPPLSSYMSDEQRRAYERSITVEAEKILQPTKAAADGAGVRAETLPIFSDHPADGILDVAAEADLIVMGSHGRRGVSYLALGSVASEVITRSDKPVLVVK